MSISKNGGRIAITHYEVKKTYFDKSLSLVECRLETGRTHQIRLHMSSIGHGIVGDQTYGNSKRILPKNIDTNLKKIIANFPRQVLHSYKISFFHPINNQQMSFVVDFPEDIKNNFPFLEIP